MPRQEDIRNTIWQDLDELSNEAMLLYIWSWTNERCGSSGLYRCPKRLLCEGRLDADVLERSLEECEAAGKLRYEGGVLWSVTRVKRLPWKTSQAAKGIASELAELDHDNPIHAEFLTRYDGFPWGKNGEGQLTLSQGSAEGRPGVGQGSGKGQPGPEDPGPEPSHQGSADPQARVTGKGKGDGKGKGKSSQETTAHVGLVVDAPPAIREALPSVVEALGRISETRAFPFADEGRICAAMCAYPTADHVAVASDMEDWLCNSDHGKRQAVKDLVQTYRNQLQRKTGSSAGGNGASADAGKLAEYDEAVVQSG